MHYNQKSQGLHRRRDSCLFSYGFSEQTNRIRIAFQPCRYSRAVVLYSKRHNLINAHLPLRLSNPHKLLMTLPQIQQKTKRHKPHLFRSEVQLRRAVIEQPSEQFIIVYSAVTAFFEVSSLSTFRFVPLSIASVIASLYSASSPGEVRSSTVSSVSSGFLSPHLRL